MKSFVAGTFLGAALGAAAMFFWINAGDESAKEQMAWKDPAATNEAEPSSSPDGTRSKRNPFDIVEAPPAATGTTQSLSQSKPTPSVSTPTALNSSTTKPPSDSRITVTDPIPMSDAHREMLKTVRDNGRLVQEQHVALEEEPRDEGWSHYMEQMLGSYLSERAPRAGVEIFNITCRTTKCEIQAFDNSGPNTLSGLLGQATKETWWEFSSMDAQASDYGTRTRTLIFLGRHIKTKEPQQKQVTLSSPRPFRDRLL